MCVCVRVCVRACVRVCVCVCPTRHRPLNKRLIQCNLPARVFVNARVYVFVNASVYVYVCVHLYLNEYVSVCMCVPTLAIIEQKEPTTSVNFRYVNIRQASGNVPRIAPRFIM